MKRLVALLALAACLVDAAAQIPTLTPTRLPTAPPTLVNVTSHMGDDGSSNDDSSNTDEGNLWILGVVFGLLGSIAINTGNNFQSLGMQQLEEKRQQEAVEQVGPDGTVKVILPDEYPPSASKTWIYGTVIFVSGSLFNFASYAFAAQSLLASLEAIQFVTNIAFGKLLLGKTVTPIMYLGTVLVCTGTILTVIFSSKEQATFSAVELLLLYKNPGYIVYLLVLIVGGPCIHLLHLRYQARQDAGRPLPHSHLVLPITYAVFSALFGTQSVVQIKCVAALLFTLGLGGALSEPFTYLFLGVWIVFVVVWLMRLNEALGKYEPMFIIPLFQVNFIFFAIVSGGIYFQEFNGFNALQWTGFVLGSALSFTGLALLVPKLDAKVAPTDGELATEAFKDVARESTEGAQTPPPPAPPFPEDECKFASGFVFGAPSTEVSETSDAESRGLVVQDVESRASSSQGTPSMESGVLPSREAESRP